MSRLWLYARNRNAHKKRFFFDSNIHATGWLFVLAGRVRVGDIMAQASACSPCGAFVAYSVATSTELMNEISGSSKPATVFIVRPSPIYLPTTSACSCLPPVLHILPLSHTCVRLSFSTSFTSQNTRLCLPPSRTPFLPSHSFPPSCLAPAYPRSSPFLPSCLWQLVSLAVSRLALVLGPNWAI